MFPFGVTIPVTAPQRSEIPQGLMNKPVNGNIFCDFLDLYFAVFCVATQCDVAGGYQHFAETYRFRFQSRRLGSSAVLTCWSEA
jgi:hypothetical protein